MYVDDDCEHLMSKYCALLVHYDHMGLKSIALKINGNTHCMDHLDFASGGFGLTAYQALVKAISISNSGFCLDGYDLAACPASNLSHLTVMSLALTTLDVHLYLRTIPRKVQLLQHVLRYQPQK